MRWIGAISRRKVSAPPQQSQVKALGSGSFGAGQHERPRGGHYLDRAALHRAETGDRIPSLAFWIDWADTLGTSLEKVIGEARKRVGKKAGPQSFGEAFLDGFIRSAVYDQWDGGAIGIAAEQAARMRELENTWNNLTTTGARYGAQPGF